jgi:hypothetical protein
MSQRSGAKMSGKSLVSHELAAYSTGSLSKVFTVSAAFSRQGSDWLQSFQGLPQAVHGMLRAMPRSANSAGVMLSGGE